MTGHAFALALNKNHSKVEGEVYGATSDKNGVGNFGYWLWTIVKVSILWVCFIGRILSELESGRLLGLLGTLTNDLLSRTPRLFCNRMISTFWIELLRETLGPASGQHFDNACDCESCLTSVPLLGAACETNWQDLQRTQEKRH